MAIFTVVSDRNNNNTIVPDPKNSFMISTLEAEACNSRLYQDVDQMVYHNGSATTISVGDMVFTDQGLTTLKNNTGLKKIYNINNGNFMMLDIDGSYIPLTCD
tara:strand:- start:3583 stop:3891 length:309 start_codon:yes stop_codon:yes gene_type:complete